MQTSAGHPSVAADGYRWADVVECRADEVPSRFAITLPRPRPRGCVLANSSRCTSGSLQRRPWPATLADSERRCRPLTVALLMTGLEGDGLVPAPLLETKLYVPRSRRGLVSRPRLSERLDRGTASKLMLISAPAGFGKTTLFT